MVQTMDTAAAEAVAKLENIADALRARGFNEASDRVRARTDEILDTIFNALSLMGSEEIVVQDNSRPLIMSELYNSPQTNTEDAVASQEHVPDTAAGEYLQGTSSTDSPEDVNISERNSIADAEEESQSRPNEASYNNTQSIATPSADQAKETAAAQQSIPLTTARALVRMKEPKQLKPPTETDGKKEAGVVFLSGNFKLPNTLYFITSKISDGAIFDIIMSPSENMASVIFQHSVNAGNFLRRNQNFKEKHGFGLHGKGYTTASGPVIPWDDQLKAMAYPYRERRRLTFARAGLISSRLTPEQFRADMGALVGEDNVESTWVFNAGNATAVFRGTGVARGVYQYFRGEGSKVGKYIDVDVSYSTDPCERKIEFSTQLREWQISPRSQQPQESQSQQPEQPAQPAKPTQHKSRRSRRSRGIGKAI